MIARLGSRRLVSKGTAQTTTEISAAVRTTAVCSAVPKGHRAITIYAIYVITIYAMTIYAMTIYAMTINAMTIYAMTIYAMTIYAMTI